MFALVVGSGTNICVLCVISDLCAPFNAISIRNHAARGSKGHALCTRTCVCVCGITMDKGGVRVL